MFSVKIEEDYNFFE